MPLRNLIIILVAAVGSLICYEKTQRNRYAVTFSEAMHIVNRYYVDEVDSRILFEGAMDGMMDRLDEHSAYYGPEQLPRFQENLDQRFAGIGIIVKMNDETKQLSVAYPLMGQPAERADIRKGDTIIAIDGTLTKDLPMDEAVDLMRGKDGEVVRLRVMHLGSDQPDDIKIKRAIIPMKSVLGDSRRKDGSWNYVLDEDHRIGYIRLTTFGERFVGELKEALKFDGEDVDAFILDLRGNSGGLLDTAVEICDMFIDDTHLNGRILSTRGRGGDTRDEYFAEEDVEVPKHLPMVVMVNGLSASASEILAACLKDHDRAIVVGERTWGKGTVQNIIHMEGGRSALKLTTASYWRPNGQNIHRGHDEKREKIPYEPNDERKWGVRPNDGYEVIMEDELRRKVIEHRQDRDYTNGPLPPAPPKDEDDESGPADDPQLRKAIDYLQEQLGAPANGSKAA